MQSITKQQTFTVGFQRVTALKNTCGADTHIVQEISIFYKRDNLVASLYPIVCGNQPAIGLWESRNVTVKPVYNDHPTGYFSDFWSSSRWPRAT